MSLNPGNTGQWLWGTYYDVRPVKNIATGASDPQDVNIQINNTNPRASSIDCYNPQGGLIAKVRFRESKTSREVLSFDIVLSCAEVWTGKVELRPGENLPTIVSSAPILTGSTSSQFTTGPDLAGGRQFTLPPGLEPEDVQRGYFEVIAEEALPCEPVDCEVLPTGNVWNRLPATNRTPTNSLSAEVILIRVSAGISYIYTAEAVTRYVADGGGSVFNTVAGKPSLSNCVAEASQDCLDQMDFVLAKSRIMAQYDIQESTGGATRVVFTMPTKGYHCALNSGKTDFAGTASPPFSCEGEDTANPKVGGEKVGCVPYNRLEDRIGASCTLPREMSIVGIVADDSSTAKNMAALSDELIDVTSIARDHLSGSVDFNLVRDPSSSATILHQLKSVDVNLLGAPYTGFNGLPVLTLTLQEYLNATLQPVGVYGGAAETPYDVEYLD